MRRLSGIEGFAVRSLGRLSSARGRAASLAILTYHRVLPQRDSLLPGEPSASEFKLQMDLLADNFNVLPLRDGIGRLGSGSLPARAVCITFDDGYANNLEVAQPILASRSLPATIFVAPGYLGRDLMFNDMIIEAIRAAPEQLDLAPVGLGAHRLSDNDARLKAIDLIIDALKYEVQSVRSERARAVTAIAGVREPPSLMMTEQQIHAAHKAGFEIGAHTVTHPILTKTDPKAAAMEIVSSRAMLQDIIGDTVASFAYPNGRPGRDYDPSHVAMVRDAGFDLAVSTAWGTASGASPLYELPRISVWDRDPLRFAGRIIKAYRQRRHEVSINHPSTWAGQAPA